MHRQAEKSIFPDSLETIGWLPKSSNKAVFIPIGANIPEPLAGVASSSEIRGTSRTVAIFCLTGAPHFHRELREIAEASLSVVGNGTRIRLLFLGRGTAEAREEITHAFSDMSVEISVMGLLPAAEITETLLRSDAMLCVRGTVYPRRGTAIAGIACGLPIVGYRGPETIFPITEAGLELVPYSEPGALGPALSRVLSDNHLRQQLRNRSLRAHAEYFSWEKIAERFSTELFNG
jgi:glycosyltransferase involved in cell wall biosynthesis